MSVEELKAKYLEVVKRPTGSDSKAYLVWKIREAEKGRVPVGPRKGRQSKGEPNDMRILPVRLEAAVVDKMDEAWRSRGIKNRMEFFRSAFGHYLAHLGAEAAAAAFTEASAA
jgi:hypothetical protein